MFKLLLCCFLFVCFISLKPVYAETWLLKLDANITLNQAVYSDNWTGGEVGSIAWTSNLLAIAEKQLHAKLNNRNTLKLSFGQTYSQDKDTDEWIAPLKSTDLIDFETLFRFSLGAFADPYIAGRLESQFYDDRDPNAGNFFDPVEFTEGFGVLRVLIDKDDRLLTARAGLALKQQIDRGVLDTLLQMRGTESRNYAGNEFVTEFGIPLAGDLLSFNSKFMVFKALFSSEASAAAGQEQTSWQQPDMDWENILTAHITKYVMVNLYLKLLYDKEVDPDLRFKQTLSLGFTFKVQ